MVVRRPPLRGIPDPAAFGQLTMDFFRQRVRGYQQPMSRLSASTVLDALHAAHAQPGGAACWADDVRDVLCKRVPGALAVEASTYHASDGSLELHGSPFARRRAIHVTSAGHATLDAWARREIYETTTFVRSARAFFGGVVPDSLAEEMRRQGIGDILGIAQPAADRRTAHGLTILCDTGTRLDRASARRWAALIRHLGALEDARRLLTFENQAPIEGASRVLAAMDRARARATRDKGEAAEEALDLWTRFLDEGWTIIEDTSRGGRRRVMAIRIADPKWVSPSPRRLPLAEREVVTRVAKGLTNKEIAYELGVSPATVEMRLRRAQQRLGIRSRLELVRLAHLLGGIQ